MAGIDNLKPWKPGQSGNPNGYSRKARANKLLRECVAEGLQATIPPEVSDVLGKHLEGITVGQAIAQNLLLSSLAGDRFSLGLIASMEPKAFQIEAEVEGVEPKSPMHVPQPEDEAALLADVHTGEQVH